MTKRQPQRPAAHPSVSISLLALTALTISAYTVAHAVVFSANPLIAGISIIPLFLVIRLASPITAGLCGAWWGLVFCLFAGARLPAHEFGPAGVMLLLTGGPALYAYGGAVFTRRYGFQPLALALGWIVLELAFHPAGFRQGLLPSCYSDGIAQHAIADFLGYGFVAFAVALINAVAILLTARLIRHRAYGFRPSMISTIPRLQPATSVFPTDPLLASSNRPRAPPRCYIPDSAIKGDNVCPGDLCISMCKHSRQMVSHGVAEILLFAAPCRNDILRRMIL